jgi:hypothetical protein
MVAVSATIFLHAHLQVVYYNCVKFHKTPKSQLGGVALTRYTTPLFVKVYVDRSFFIGNLLIFQSLNIIVLQTGGITQ